MVLTLFRGPLAVSPVFWLRSDYFLLTTLWVGRYRKCGKSESFSSIPFSRIMKCSIRLFHAMRGGCSVHPWPMTCALCENKFFLPLRQSSLVVGTPCTRQDISLERWHPLPFILCGVVYNTITLHVYDVLDTHWPKVPTTPSRALGRNIEFGGMEHPRITDRLHTQSHPALCTIMYWELAIQWRSRQLMGKGKRVRRNNEGKRLAIGCMRFRDNRPKPAITPYLTQKVFSIRLFWFMATRKVDVGRRYRKKAVARCLRGARG
jgi:hypothetical protein